MSIDAVVVAMNFKPELAGCGKYTGELTAHLAKAGYRLLVLTTPPHYPGWRVANDRCNTYSSEQVDGAHVVRCPLLLRENMRGIWRLLASASFAATVSPVALWNILRRRPAVVLLVEPTLLAAPVVLLAARLVGARTVLHVQDLEVDAAFATGHLSDKPFLRWLAMRFEKFCLQAFGSIVTISDQMEVKLREKGIDPKRITIVRNWVDLDHIRPLERSRRYCRELGLPEDAFIVLYSGNLGLKQDLGVVIEAARRLQHCSDIVFVIAGEGPEKTALEAAASELTNVRFLAFQPYFQLPEFLAIADIHVLPQQAAAADLVLPSKLGGMLASGRRIVAAADPNTELARFLGGAASLFPPGNSVELAYAIEVEYENPSKAHIEKQTALARQLSATDALERFEKLLFANSNGYGTRLPVHF